LGYVINNQGVARSTDRIHAVLHRPVPVNVKELRSFLGLAGYYRKFVKHFGIIAKPLTALLKKNVMFVWSSDQHQHTAFETLKAALVEAPILALPDFSKPFLVEIDAYDFGVGAVLMQEGHPISFVSKALGPRLRGLSTYERICCYIVGYRTVEVLSAVSRVYYCY
jgi:hypothetical protein